ncbi:BA14K family protein [Bradyrhizobium sp. CB2312]|uniref:BA14K family protein n=1 Tax=Bradyrhizobium sp. CB2312 TaxID=3039155 RepID=UPI0024B133B2|nr:BA14K family protein [Bradyrhizobium sp. CB2312]WFU71761.1 BA14K family protein [Bradyrhizobium sp. CB2312]
MMEIDYDWTENPCCRGCAVGPDCDHRLRAIRFCEQPSNTYEAENPNRNLNGTLTPAGRRGLELPDGAAGVGNVLARADGATSRSCAERFRSFDPATGTYLGFDGNRHPCR